MVLLRPDISLRTAEVVDRLVGGGREWVFGIKRCGGGIGSLWSGEFSCSQIIWCWWAWSEHWDVRVCSVGEEVRHEARNPEVFEVVNYGGVKFVRAIFPPWGVCDPFLPRICWC